MTTRTTLSYREIALKALVMRFVEIQTFGEEGSIRFAPTSDAIIKVHTWKPQSCQPRSNARPDQLTAFHRSPTRRTGLPRLVSAVQDLHLHQPIVSPLGSA